MMKTLVLGIISLNLLSAFQFAIAAEIVRTEEVSRVEPSKAEIEKKLELRRKWENRPPGSDEPPPDWHINSYCIYSPVTFEVKSIQTPIVQVYVRIERQATAVDRSFAKDYSSDTWMPIIDFTFQKSENNTYSIVVGRKYQISKDYYSAESCSAGKTFKLVYFRPR